MSEIYRKNNHVTTQAEAETLLAEMDDFKNNPAPGMIPPILDIQLMKIWNDGEHLEWTWSAESEQEEAQRLAKEQAEADLLAFYQNPINLEAWKDAKVRPWRNAMLYEWIDKPRIQELHYNFENWTQETLDEREAKRQELLDWPGTFAIYKTDAEIDAAKPTAPSWAT